MGLGGVGWALGLDALVIRRHDAGVTWLILAVPFGMALTACAGGAVSWRGTI
jgi:hypothetical protein